MFCFPPPSLCIHHLVKIQVATGSPLLGMTDDEAADLLMADVQCHLCAAFFCSVRSRWLELNPANGRARYSRHFQDVFGRVAGWQSAR